MKNIFILLVLFLSVFPLNSDAATTTWLVAGQGIPVFNTAAAAESRKAVKPDACGQVRALEFIALPGTVFTVKRQTGKAENPIFEVTTAQYTTPPGVQLYISGHGTNVAASKPEEPLIEPPEEAEIMRRLKGAIGAPYVWGGNLRKGVRLPEEEKVYAGLDCSGLLYEATGGYTPRNTSELVSFGRPVPVAGLGRDQIIKKLKPLDLIVWKGHVIIVLNSHETIESVLWCGRPGNGGVATMQLRQRLGEIMSRRKGVDSWPEGGGKPQIFVVRRWIGI